MTENRYRERRYIELGGSTGTVKMADRDGEKEKNTEGIKPPVPFLLCERICENIERKWRIGGVNLPQHTCSFHARKEKTTCLSGCNPLGAATENAPKGVLGLWYRKWDSLPAISRLCWRSARRTSRLGPEARPLKSLHRSDFKTRLRVPLDNDINKKHPNGCLLFMVHQGNPNPNRYCSLRLLSHHPG